MVNYLDNADLPGWTEALFILSIFTVVCVLFLWEQELHFRWKWAIPTGASLAPAFGVLGGIVWLNAPRPGVLIPDHEPMPEWVHKCDNTNWGPADQLMKVIMGRAVYFAVQNPQPLIQVWDYNRSDYVIENAMEFEVSSDGSLLISITVRGSDNRDRIARINKNVWELPSSGTVSWAPHAVVVKDGAGDVVLDLHFMNPRTIHLREARFAYPGAPPLVVKDGQLYTDFGPTDRAPLEACAFGWATVEIPRKEDVQ
jgi:hypothetical protein